MLAILLGSLISTPIVLRIFESEINNQISVIKENNEANFLSSQQHSSVQAPVTKWQNTVTNLEQVIDSNGAQPINPANDPVVQGLTTQLNNEREGRDTGLPRVAVPALRRLRRPQGLRPARRGQQAALPGGRGPDHDAHQRDQRQGAALQDNSASAQQTRLQQAKNALPDAQAQLAAAQAEENSLLNNFQATNSATNGLLIRLQALDQLTAKGGSLSARPVAAVPAVPGHRDTAGDGQAACSSPASTSRSSQTADQHQLRQAKWVLRSGVGAPLPGGPGADRSEDLRPSGRDGGFAPDPFGRGHDPTPSWSGSSSGPRPSSRLRTRPRTTME